MQLEKLFNDLADFTSDNGPKLIRPIVPIEQWVYSTYYASPDIDSLYPFWKEHMINIFNSSVNINEVILHGSLGGGKSTFACFLALRKIYELSCYDIPQKLFSLQMSTVISAVLFSVSKEVAEGGIYGQLRALIDSTPYFKEHFPRDKNLKYDVMWSEKRMRVGYGSNANDQIGQNMYLGVLDEGNFFQGEANGSMQSAKTMSKSQNLYLTLRRRGENRFSTGGIDFSLSVLISSARTSNSMVERRIESTRGNPHVYVIHAVSYEIVPQKYSPEKFNVFLGNDLMDPLVIEHISDIKNICDSLQLPFNGIEDIDQCIEAMDEDTKCLFTKVPVSLKKSYQDDIISALQDLSGISVSPMGRLFTSRKHFSQCIDETLEHPFIQDNFVISTGNTIEVKDFLRSDWKPKDIQKARFLHIDQSITTDDTGIGCCYIDRFERSDTGELLPIIVVDFFLQIVPPSKPNEIDIAKCRSFVIYLKKHYGLKIGKCTYDQHQSRESIQQLRLQGIESELLSVDRTANEYKQFCNLIYNNRISFYHYPLMEKELFELLYFRGTNKVDHPDQGKKDIMDGIVGAVTNALNSDELTQQQISQDAKLLLDVYSSMGM